MVMVELLYFKGSMVVQSDRERNVTAYLRIVAGLNLSFFHPKAFFGDLSKK